METGLTDFRRSVHLARTSTDDPIPQVYRLFAALVSFPSPIEALLRATSKSHNYSRCSNESFSPSLWILDSLPLKFVSRASRTCSSVNSCRPLHSPLWRVSGLTALLIDPRQSRCSLKMESALDTLSPGFGLIKSIRLLSCCPLFSLGFSSGIPGGGCPREIARCSKRD